MTYMTNIKNPRLVRGLEKILLGLCPFPDAVLADLETFVIFPASF